MKTLADYVTVIENNDRCIILKVKNNCRMGLIALGCFSGDEDMIRWSKDSVDTITVFTNDGKHYSWTRGTLVTENMREKRIMIMKFIETL